MSRNRTFEIMPSSKPVRHIRPKQSISSWLKQLIERRETLWFFIWKDLKVQYQKPVFGFLWSVFQPLVYFGVILSVMKFSGRESNIASMPFPLYLLAGLTLWNFFTSSILGAINSIQSNAGVISKSFFPRFYLVLAPFIKNMFDLLIMVMILFGFGFYLSQPIVLSKLGLVISSLGIAFLTTLGCSAIIASLVVHYHHIRHVIPVILHALIFGLPVFYSTTSVENSILQTVYQVNPVAGAMDLLRCAFGPSCSMKLMIFWLLQSLLWFIIGIILFRNTERTLVDHV